MTTTPKHGFTLIETLVAITILIFAVTGAFAAAKNGVFSSALSKDEITGIYLVQEGIEQIRNLRDDNGLLGQNWLTGIAASSNDPCYFTHACAIDAGANTVTACSGGASSCPVLRQDPTSGLYGYNGAWTATPYTRSITLTQINANEVEITATVTWTKAYLTHSFTARENIFNWQ